MKYDELNGKNVIYRGAALLPGKPAAAFWAVVGLAALCAAALKLLSPLPYSVFAQVIVLLLTAVALNRVLRRGTFSVSYALTDDGELVYVTKYGRIERETAWIRLAEAEINANTIIYENRKYEFYPDEELKSLIVGNENIIKQTKGE